MDTEEKIRDMQKRDKTIRMIFYTIWIIFCLALLVTVIVNTALGVTVVGNILTIVFAVLDVVPPIVKCVIMMRSLYKKS